MIGGRAAQAAFDLVGEATAMLELAGIESARQDAEWLLAAVLGAKRFALYLEPRREVAEAEAERYFALVRRRAARTPLQHLSGFEDFHGLRFVVTRDVLVPRPETEGLVDWALNVLHDQPAAAIADVGTGSGVIACTLAHRRPGARVLAIDRSLSALAVASINVRALGLSRRVKLMAGDLLAPLGSRGRRLDLVITNPPYIPSASLRGLPPEVARFDPREALDGGPDGMAVSRRIIMEAASVLRRGGWLMLEIGEEQAGPLASLMAAEGFTQIEARRDLLGAERYLGGRWADGAAVTRPEIC